MVYCGDDGNVKWGGEGSGGVLQWGGFWNWVLKDLQKWGDERRGQGVV